MTETLSVDVTLRVFCGGNSRGARGAGEGRSGQTQGRKMSYISRKSLKGWIRGSFEDARKLEGVRDSPPTGHLMMEAGDSQVKGGMT